MIKKPEIWSLMILEVLFGLCALSVLVYQFTGRFDFGFEVMSYRFWNIALSVILVGFLVDGLWKKKSHILVFVTAFSLFHFIEGVVITFWYKTVIHLLILLICGFFYYRHKTLVLRNTK